MKKGLLIAALAMTVGVASAQESTTKTNGKPRFSIGLEAGLPTGTAADRYGVFLGGAAKVEVPVAPKFAFTGSAGYSNLSLDKDFKDAFEALGVDAPSADFIPVKAGGKYFFGKNFYGAAEVGASFGIGDTKGTAFVWAPGLGASFPVSAKNDIDFGVRYESWEDEGSLSQVGFHIALKF